MRWFLFTTVVIVMSSAARADIFTCDANDDGADFQSLAVAIDTVPSGSILLLRSDFAEKVVYQVTASRFESLTLLGDGPGNGIVTVEGALETGSCSSDCGDQKVLCSKVNWDSSDTDDIRTILPWTGSLHLDQCVVDAGGGLACPGASDGYTLTCTSVKFLTEQEDWPAFYQEAGGTTVFKDCVLEHSNGEAGDALWVEDGSVFHAHTTFKGEIHNWDRLEELPDTLNIWEWSVFTGSRAVFEGFGTPRGLSLLFYGIAMPIPEADTIVGPWFLRQPFTMLPLRYGTLGGWILEWDIPEDDLYLGVPIYMQAYDVKARVLSCLEGAIISQ